jgi:hypothetical protein
LQSLPPSPDYPRILPLGDAALTVEFGNAISPELNDQVVALDIALASADLDGIIETAPSYRSLLICYEPLAISSTSSLSNCAACCHAPARRPKLMRRRGPYRCSMTRPMATIWRRSRSVWL